MNSVAKARPAVTKVKEEMIEDDISNDGDPHLNQSNTFRNSFKDVNNDNDNKDNDSDPTSLQRSAMFSKSSLLPKKFPIPYPTGPKGAMYPSPLKHMQLEIYISVNFPFICSCGLEYVQLTLTVQHLWVSSAH